MEIASPPAKRLAVPRWLNPRLAAGTALVLVSAVAGAKVVAGADASELVWAARRDLPVGYQLTTGDLSAVRVRLGSAASRYVAAAGAAPAGYVVRRPVAAGELITGSTLAAPGSSAVAAGLRVVAVPVAPGHWPHDLHAGDLVDVYATPKADSDHAAAAPSLVLAAAPVQSVPDGGHSVLGGGDPSASVELSVPIAQVAGLVKALETSAIDIVRSGPQGATGDGSGS